ncbi:MAG: hypothetical protein EOO92_00330 [Pedobacter sp.]|nr:MAG: hypothetical protein EOO92_00330 [Pedobacter sp.]
MTEMETWQQTQMNLLDSKVVALNDGYRKIYGYNYISNAIKKIPVISQTDIQLEKFKAQTETLIGLFPEVIAEGKKYNKEYLKVFSSYKGYLMIEYKMVVKGYHRTVWMPLGIGIGLSFGVALKNIALGIPIGLGIGIAIGSGLDAKAEKEGKVL